MQTSKYLIANERDAEWGLTVSTVGYEEMFEYLDGLTTLDECIFKIQSNSRRYCRKQQTWFKRDASIHWFCPDNIKEIINFIDTSLVG